jgi:hypothetical protein
MLSNFLHTMVLLILRTNCFVKVRQHSMNFLQLCVNSCSGYIVAYKELSATVRKFTQRIYRVAYKESLKCNRTSSFEIKLKKSEEKIKFCKVKQMLGKLFVHDGKIPFVQILVGIIVGILGTLVYVKFMKPQFIFQSAVLTNDYTDDDSVLTVEKERAPRVVKATIIRTNRFPPRPNLPDTNSDLDDEDSDNDPQIKNERITEISDVQSNDAAFDEKLHIGSMDMSQL